MRANVLPLPKPEAQILDYRDCLRPAACNPHINFLGSGVAAPGSGTPHAPRAASARHGAIRKKTADRRQPICRIPQRPAMALLRDVRVGENSQVRSLRRIRISLCDPVENSSHPAVKARLLNPLTSVIRLYQLGRPTPCTKTLSPRWKPKRLFC